MTPAENITLDKKILVSEIKAAIKKFEDKTETINFVIEIETQYMGDSVLSRKINVAIRL